MWILIFFFLVHASTPLGVGDRLWGKGEYREAFQQWKIAASSEDKAVVAMAEYRMMLLASNLTLPIHGIKGDSALNQCPTDNMRCLLARIDRELIMGIFGFPSDIGLARNLLNYTKDPFPAETLARKVWLGDADVAYLKTIERDGVGEVLLGNSGKWPRGPGGAVYGLGFFAVRNLGFGGTISWFQPNLEREEGYMNVLLTAATSGYGIFSFTRRSGGSIFFHFEGDTKYAPYFRRNSDDTWESRMISSGRILPAAGFRKEQFNVWLGPQLRWDDFEKPQAGHGLFTSMSMSFIEQIRIEQSVELAVADYWHLRSTTQFRFVSPKGPAFFIAADLCPGTEAPWWRQPTAGGGRFLRLPPAQWIRAKNIYSAAAEWRFRQQEMLGFVLFGEGSYTDHLAFMGGGIGLRLNLPPQPSNTIRLDIGYGTSGWGVLAGAREFF